MVGRKEIMPITIKSNQEAEKLIKNGILAINDDLEIAFDGFSIEADIKCHNIYSKDGRRGIDARNISAGDITAWDINARDIDAGDITAGNINARNISYFAVCFAYENIVCKSIEGGRENAKHFCLDGKITYKEEEPQTGKKVRIKINSGQEIEGILIE